MDKTVQQIADQENANMKLKAEIDRLVKENKFITEGSNRALKAQQAEIDELKEDFIRLHTMAVKWVDKDHQDWQELMKLRWGG